MPIIKHNQFIDAPIEICFDLARDVKTHTKTTSNTKEKAVTGVTEGLLVKGDTVTWEAVHFGIKQRLTAKITYMKIPYQFEEKNGGTIMIDTFEYRSPFGLIGRMADRLFLEEYMRKFIISRSKALKKIAEKINT